MAEVAVSVTREDIDNGTHCGGSCPCGLAGVRALPQFPRQHFTTFSWYPFGSRDDRGIEIPLRREVIEWIDGYDMCQLAIEAKIQRGCDHTRSEPFTFILDVPDGLLPAVDR